MLSLHPKGKQPRAMKWVAFCGVHFHYNHLNNYLHFIFFFFFALPRPSRVFRAQNYWQNAQKERPPENWRDKPINTALTLMPNRENASIRNVTISRVRKRRPERCVSERDSRPNSNSKTAPHHYIHHDTITHTHIYKQSPFCHPLEMEIRLLLCQKQPT